MSKYDELKNQSWEANLALREHHIALFTFGNVSAIDRNEGVFAIKPSGIPYSVLKPEEMVIVDMQNKVVDGKLRPSSDTETHTVLYNHFPEIGGIAHTHSTYATAWSQAQKSIPIFGTTHADLLSSDIPCTNMMTEEQIKGNYEEETGYRIIETFSNKHYDKTGMVLVAGHGPFTWGKSASKAVYNAVMLEELAKTAFLTLQINPDTDRLSKSLINKHFQRKHGSNAYYGQKPK